MKLPTPARSGAALLLLLAGFNGQLSALAQGSLTPPGPPAPLMKSLDQIEARTPITNGNSLVTISQPGSYYLTQSLTVSSGDAIDITTGNVTLDLNGFTISSTAPSANGTAIYLAAGVANSDTAIFNGHIKSGVTNNAGSFSGPGFINGIIWNFSGNGLPYNVSVSRVSVAGCSGVGILLPAGSIGSPSYATLVESCQVRTTGGVGIQAATVLRSNAHECGGQGIFAETVSDCHGETLSANSVVSGIQAQTANNSYGYAASTANGLTAYAAQNCFAYSGSGKALNIAGTAIGCYAYSPSGVAIGGNMANSCYIGGGTSAITYKYNMP